MSDYTRNPQAIESTNTDNPYEPLSESKVGDTELLPGDSPAPGVCRVVMLPPEAIEKDKDLDRKTTERAAQVHAGAAELAAESASPFKTDLPTSESMEHPVETANMALNTAGTAVSESLLSAQDSASATLASAKQSAASTLDSASSTLDSAKKSASSTLASAQDSTGQALDQAKQSTASTLASARDTAASTLASARDTAASTLSSAQQSAASTLASAQQSAASAASTIQDTTSTALASARDTASSTLTSAQQSASSAAATIQDTASSTLTAAQSTAASAASTIQDTAASTLTSLQHAGTTTLHKAQDLGSATADVASRSMHATQDTATSLVSSTADSIRRVSASIATTASEVLHSAEETAAKVAVQVLETVEHSIERLREDYVGPAQASAQEQLSKDVKERHEAQAKGKLASVKDEVSQVANTAVASAEDMLRTASEGAAATIGVDPGVQVQVTPGALDEDVASVSMAEGSDAGEQAPVEGFQDDALLVIRDGLPADKDSERVARKVIRAMEKETAHELMEEDDTASMTA